MGLQDEILNTMEQITDDEKKTIGDFMKKMYTQNPSKQINLEIRSVKSIKCIDEGSWAIVAITSSKIQSASEWLSKEGFTLLKGYSQKGLFWGYKVFLTNEFASL